MLLVAGGRLGRGGGLTSTTEVLRTFSSPAWETVGPLPQPAQLVRITRVGDTLYLAGGDHGAWPYLDGKYRLLLYQFWNSDFIFRYSSI